MLAVRFPRVSERAVQNSPCPATTSEREVSAQTPPDPGSGRPDAPPFELSAQTPSLTVETRNSGHGRITPLSADAFELQVTIRRGTREVLQTIQNLLGHAIPPGDLAALPSAQSARSRAHLWAGVHEGEAKDRVACAGTGGHESAGPAGHSRPGFWSARAGIPRRACSTRCFPRHDASWSHAGGSNACGSGIPAPTSRCHPPSGGLTPMTCRRTLPRPWNDQNRPVQAARAEGVRSSAAGGALGIPHA